MNALSHAVQARLCSGLKTGLKIRASRSAYLSHISVPSSGAQCDPKSVLKSLDTTQLCHLVRCSGLPDCVSFIKAEELTGMHIIDGIESAQDLIDSGLTVIKAKTLYKRIEEWKTVGFPTSFDVNCYAPTPISTSTRSTVCQEDNIAPPDVVLTSTPGATHEPLSSITQMEQDYNTARWCSDLAATQRLLHAAQQDHPIAQMHVSVLYEKGCKSFPADKKISLEYVHKALPWLQEHASTGHAEAQYYLGYLYLNGIVLPKNEAEGIRYYGLAADQGLSIALNALGTCYLFGIGVPKYEEVGVSYFRQAIAKGSIVAEINLASCYLNGSGVEVNETEAVRLFRMPADLGYANVQHYLGMCYLNGKGVAQDNKKALKWLLLAAAQDYVDSIVTLGYLHERGQHAPLSMRAALRYYQRGAALGSQYAVQAAERVLDRAEAESEEEEEKIEVGTKEEKEQKTSVGKNGQEKDTSLGVI